MKKDDIINPKTFESNALIYRMSPFQTYFNTVKDLFIKESEKISELVTKEIEESKKLSIDETFLKRKELIEDYANKRAEVEKLLKADEELIESLDKETKEAFEKYQLKKLGTNIFKDGLNDESDNESDLFFKREIAKKQYEIDENTKKYGHDNFTNNVDSFGK